MIEVLLLCGLLFPQTVAGIFAKSMGRSFWFWFFISFLIPIISLVVLACLKDKSESSGFKLADHLNHLPTEKEPKSVNRSDT